MIPLVVICLLVNVAFTVTLPILMLQSGSGMDIPYGVDTPARRILACLYASIAAVSLFALSAYAIGRSEELLLRIVMVLFPIQITYKLATVFAVGIDNPVVRSNVAISLLLAAALVAIWLQARVET